MRTRRKPAPTEPPHRRQRGWREWFLFGLAMVVIGIALLSAVALFEPFGSIGTQQPDSDSLAMRVVIGLDVFVLAGLLLSAFAAMMWLLARVLHRWWPATVEIAVAAPEAIKPDEPAVEVGLCDHPTPPPVLYRMGESLSR